MSERTEELYIKPETRELIRDLREKQFLGWDDDAILREVLLIPRYLEIADDTRKVIVYSKGEGYWYWHDRGEDAELSEPFYTYIGCLRDAIGPYLEDIE